MVESSTSELKQQVLHFPADGQACLRQKMEQTETELRRRTRELSSFVETAAIGLHWVGPDGTIQWANAADMQLLGYEPHEYIGRHISEFHVDQDVIREILAKLHAGERLRDFEARLRCKDGSIKIVLIDSSVLWENGEFVHTQCFTRDISQRKRDEEAARRLAAIVEHSDDAIISTTLEGIITSWNHGAAAIYGYTEEEAVGKSISIIIPPERRDEEKTILEKIRGGALISHYETMRRHKEGRLLEISVTISPLKDSTGRIIGASKIARDITERKRVEREQKALFELVTTVNRASNLGTVLDAAIEAISRCQNVQKTSILLNDDQGVMRFRAWRGLSDAYRTAVEGHSPWSPEDPNPQPVLIPNVAKAGIDEKLKEVVLGEGIQAVAFIPITYENRLLGKFMLYYDRPRSFRIEEIRPAQTIASQVAFAIERQKTGELLERLVNERTVSLREAVAQMEEFSYTVSHDLRAPLRGMQVYAKALMEDFSEALPAEGRHYLKRLADNANRLDKMILDVLTFSRIARSELHLERVSMDKLARQIVEHYPGMQRPHAEISIQQLHDVIGHEPSLTQAISNLLSNAIKFIEPGKVPKVKVWSEKRDGRIRIWVEDNGIGIPPQYHHRLFNMFERVHANLKYDGTGVGLAIVRKAVERMGGSVGMESDGVNGSRFWIEVRAIDSND